MIYINSIKFKEDYRNLKKGLKIELPEITVLVGDQGCGKSSILNLLQKADSKVLNIDLTPIVKEKGIHSFYFDTESMNPRRASMEDYTTPSGQDKGIGVRGFLASKFQSHGEVLKVFTVDMLAKAKDSVILLDEPESGLSVMNQYKLVKALKKALKANTQIVIASHCVPLIKSFDQVYDLENKTWISGNDYVNSFK